MEDTPDVDYHTQDPNLLSGKTPPKDLLGAAYESPTARRNVAELARSARVLKILLHDSIEIRGLIREIASETTLDANNEPQAAFASAECTCLAHDQIDRLANFFITNEIPGEPSQSQSVVDTAIRLLKRYAVPDTSSPWKNIEPLANAIEAVNNEYIEDYDTSSTPAVIDSARKIILRLIPRAKRQSI